ncbi:hypothetical protein OH76DRAFT_684356 [Lentinus brumalis]|uniref:Uncharacterized protein n=1 Tax=Lentinus brumalis TaxID=2498619 RepID=A0A371D6V8_9APHY|nr:hypothetical protein OH76DRAFT_684356 [Polyporus brumalis]
MTSHVMTLCTTTYTYFADCLLGMDAVAVLFPCIVLGTCKIAASVRCSVGLVRTLKPACHEYCVCKLPALLATACPSSPVTVSACTTNLVLCCHALHECLRTLARTRAGCEVDIYRCVAGCNSVPACIPYARIAILLLY